MKKKPLLTLEPEDLEADFSEYAFLLFHSQSPSFAFVDDLNHLYGLQLERQDDIQLRDSAWPLFSAHNEVMHRDYFLVECPLAIENPLWAPRNKMLIIRGEDADNIVDNIDREFNTPPPHYDKSDILSTERYSLIASFQAELTLTTILRPDEMPNHSLSRKTQKEQSELVELLADILDCIDYMHIA